MRVRIEPLKIIMPISSCQCAHWNLIVYISEILNYIFGGSGRVTGRSKVDTLWPHMPYICLYVFWWSRSKAKHEWFWEQNVAKKAAFWESLVYIIVVSNLTADMEIPHFALRNKETIWVDWNWMLISNHSIILADLSE